MDDKDIVNLYWKRDEAAIKISQEKYGVYLKNIAINILHSTEDSEECVNDTWLRAWNSIPPQKPNRLALYFGKITRNLAIDRYRKEKSQKYNAGETWLAVWNDIPPQRPNVFKMFLARITRNLAINVLKANKARKRSACEGGLVLEELAECVSDGRDIARELEAKELESAIGTFVAGLPEWEGDIFIRRYFYVEKIKDIALEYKIKSHNVTMILQRTRTKLKEYLIKEGYGGAPYLLLSPLNVEVKNEMFQEKS